MGDIIQQIINGFGLIAAKLAHEDNPNKIEMLSHSEQAASDLYKELFELIDKGEICAAEDKLFEVLEYDYTDDALNVAIQFYSRLDDFSQDYLLSHNFSKQEIIDGLAEIKKFIKAY